MTDIFKFWKDYKLGDRIHPADRFVLKDSTGHHGLDLKCLPGPFYGPLKTAKIVFLYLNPGLSQLDYKAAKSKEGQKRTLERLKGYMPLSETRLNSDEKSWWVGKSKFLEFPPEYLLENLAVLQLCAYHSKSFKDGPLIAALPSSRVAIEWAQGHLFPEARDGKRVVVCLRSHKYWGLALGERYGRSLFSPATVRSGHMLKEGGMRDSIQRAAKRVLREASKT